MSSRGIVVSNFDRGKRSVLLYSVVDEVLEVTRVVEPSFNLLPSSARRDQYRSSSHISSRDRLFASNHPLWPSRLLTGIPLKVRERKTCTVQSGFSRLSFL